MPTRPSHIVVRRRQSPVVGAAFAVITLIGCWGDQQPIAYNISLVDARGLLVPAADVTVVSDDGRNGYSLSLGFPPLVGEFSGSSIIPVGSGRIAITIDAVGLLPYDDVIDVEVTSEVVLQDDPNPVAECEGKCANEVACGGQGAGAGEDACVQACLADLALTGDDLADACRPLRVVQAYCLGLLTCDGFLAFQRGEPNDCTAIPTAIADCEANGAYGP
jgi:hypothetical protein